MVAVARGGRSGDRDGYEEKMAREASWLSSLISSPHPRGPSKPPEMHLAANDIAFPSVFVGRPSDLSSPLPSGGSPRGVREQGGRQQQPVCRRGSGRAAGAAPCGGSPRPERSAVPCGGRAACTGPQRQGHIPPPPPPLPLYAALEASTHLAKGTPLFRDLERWWWWWWWQ